MTRSPLAPASFPTLPAVAGVELATLAAGLRYQKRADLMLASFPNGATTAGVFTKSLCPSAPVDWCRKILPQHYAHAVVCNAGNANAFTGRAGDRSAQLTADVIGSALGVPADTVYLASTGVIGETLPEAALAAALPILAGGRSVSASATWVEAAKAICTTDTFPKGAAARVEGSDGVVVGIAKGSGMIAPDMATMLGFVFTDLALSADVLQACLTRSAAGSYNRVTVDSDTSTSDTVLLFATGAVGADDPIATIDDRRVADFQTALDAVNLDLAHQIVRDGEGASKFITVTVTGAEHDAAATTIALAIANSPLVKTALGAEDANWGRIVMAVGKAGERADRDQLDIWIGPEQVTENGMVREGYMEDRATEHLRLDEIEIRADVGIANGVGTVWTCDLTHGYIDINASYRS